MLCKSLFEGSLIMETFHFQFNYSGHLKSLKQGWEIRIYCKCYKCAEFFASFAKLAKVIRGRISIFNFLWG